MRGKSECGMRNAEWKSIEHSAWGREHSVKTDVGRQRCSNLELGMRKIKKGVGQNITV